MVTELGGIRLLTEALSKLMGEKTANPIITVLAGVMSWFSSASGVVMPTLIPTVPGLAASLTGVSQVGLTVGLCAADLHAKGVLHHQMPRKEEIVRAAPISDLGKIVDLEEVAHQNAVVVAE